MARLNKQRVITIDESLLKVAREIFDAFQMLEPVEKVVHLISTQVFGEKSSEPSTNFPHPNNSVAKTCCKQSCHIISERYFYYANPAFFLLPPNRALFWCYAFAPVSCPPFCIAMGCFLGPKGYSQGQVVWSVRVQHMCSTSACLPVSPIPRFKTSHWMMTLARLRYVYNLLQHVLFNLDIIQYLNVYICINIYIYNIGFYRIVIIHFHPICLKMKPFTNTKALGSRHLFQRFSRNEPLSQQWIGWPADAAVNFSSFVQSVPRRGAPSERVLSRASPAPSHHNLNQITDVNSSAAKAHSLDNGRSQVCEIDWNCISPSIYPLVI